MAKDKKEAKYPCKHCGTLWTVCYLADLCFKIDMENLNKPENERKDNLATKASHYPRSNKRNS